VLYGLLFIVIETMELHIYAPKLFINKKHDLTFTRAGNSTYARQNHGINFRVICKWMRMV
jgi:hypothetical protein